MKKMVRMNDLGSFRKYYGALLLVVKYSNLKRTLVKDGGVEYYQYLDWIS